MSASQERVSSVSRWPSSFIAAVPVSRSSTATPRFPIPASLPPECWLPKTQRTPRNSNPSPSEVLRSTRSFSLPSKPSQDALSPFRPAAPFKLTQATPTHLIPRCSPHSRQVQTTSKCSTSVVWTRANSLPLSSPPFETPPLRFVSTPRYAPPSTQIATSASIPQPVLSTHRIWSTLKAHGASLRLSRVKARCFP